MLWNGLVSAMVSLHNAPYVVRSNIRHLEWREDVVKAPPKFAWQI